MNTIVIHWHITDVLLLNLLKVDRVTITLELVVMLEENLQNLSTRQ